jgi:hypothetical protein
LTWNFLQWKVSCCLHTSTFFGDTICLLTNRKMIKILTLIDLHIVLTYDYWHCFLMQYSHALEMTIHFYYPTLELFSFTQPFTKNFVCPNIFSSVPSAAKKNYRSFSLQNFASIIHWWLKTCMALLRVQMYTGMPLCS